MSDNLDTLRKIAEAPGVRPGPWHVYDRGIGYEVHDENDYELTGGMRETFDKADAEFIATFDPPTVLALLSRIEQAEQQRDSAREACKTLAEVLSKHSEWIVEATDSQDLIGEDGDGDWDVVWDRVAELGEGKRKAEQAVARVREVVANLEDHSRPRTAHKFAVAENLRRVLDGESNE